MNKIITIIIILALSALTANAYMDDENRQIALGYSFERGRPLGWCFMVLRHGIGIYVDSHTNAKGHSIDESEYYASQTREEIEKWNRFIKMETQQLQYAVGITYPLIHNNLYVYGGVGRQIEQDFYNYYDNQHAILYVTNFWVGDKRTEKTIFQSGLIFYHAPFFLRAGTSFKPVEYQIGIGLRIY